MSKKKKSHIFTAGFHYTNCMQTQITSDLQREETLLAQKQKNTQEIFLPFLTKKLSLCILMGNIFRAKTNSTNTEPGNTFPSFLFLLCIMVSTSHYRREIFMFRFNLNIPFRLVPKMQGGSNVQIISMLEKLGRIANNDHIIAWLSQSQRSNDEALDAKNIS